jgi:MFS superfamily sulfate permease-like transporter
VLPFTQWFKGYRPEHLRIDLISGLTVALVLIPQSMAYAQLAGLPAFYGLYASFLPPMVAALFGSSRQLATGPVAVVSLMTSASLAPLATAGSEAYIAYAILLALMVGVFQLALGVLRLGLVVNFLSHPVVNGFTNAAAIIIATSQLSKMFGVSVDNAAHHYETIAAVIHSAINYTHWPTLGMGALAFAIMYGLKKVWPRVPNVLVAVVVTTALSLSLGFEHNTRAPISAIKDETARKLITSFNEQIDQLPGLAQERSEINARIAALHDEVALEHVYEQQYKIDVLSLKIDRVGSRTHSDRADLRRILFEGVPGEGDEMTFYRQGELPPGAVSDGRVWRIKVGNNRLDESDLLMTGGGAVVGNIPRGLPEIAIPTVDVSVAMHLLPYAAIISLLGFMEAISIAKAMAGKTGQRLDPNQELIGQGIANILGAASRSYPTSGSFSRSAVNLQAGAVTGLSSVFTSLTVVIVLLFFTPLLYHLPQSVLAAVIMMAVIGLINVSGFIHAWKAKWYDGLISIISFVSTLAFAPHLDRGIMIGVLLSLGVFLYKSMRPKVATLARLEDESLRCAEEHGLSACRYLALIRFDGPLFFANASYLEDKITEHMRSSKDLRHIVIVANGVNDIDASGEETLSLLVDRVRAAGLGISLSGVNEEVMKVLERTHLISKIGSDNLFSTMESALRANHTQTHRDSDEADGCPLLKCFPAERAALGLRGA